MTGMKAIALALGLATAAASMGAGAEVVNRKQVPREAAETGGRKVVPEGPFSLECFQNGVRIVQESGLENLSMARRRLGSGVQFSESKDAGSTVFVSTQGTTTCVVRKE